MTFCSFVGFAESSRRTFMERLEYVIQPFCQLAAV